MGFNSIVDTVNAMEVGQTWTSYWYKSSGPTIAVPRWVDCSVGSGVPTYQAYSATPLAFTAQNGGTNKFIYTGPSISNNQQKYLFSWQFYTSTANILSALLVDVLGFYAAIDGDVTDLQTFDNTTTLPRYTSGDGVQMFMIQAAPGVSNGTATINYTNSDDVAKSITVGIMSSTTLGSSVLTSGSTISNNSISPFGPLSSGDRGVKSVDSIQFNTGIGGVYTLILVKPICTMQTGASSIPTEKVLINQSAASMPEIKPTSALTIISTGTASAGCAPSFGQFNFVWG